MLVSFRARTPAVVAASLVALLATAACDNNDTGGPNPVTGFVETDLVADATGLGAPSVDPNLQNPWGVAINQANGFLWVANNKSGTSTVYEPGGAIVNLVVSIPSATGATGGEPTGIVYNAGTDFVIPGSGAATFIFAGADGIISAWNQSTGTNATVVADRSGNDAVYLGISLIGNSLFAANFKGKTVDMFDKDFAFVQSFTDPGIPADFAPFNVQNLSGNLYVAYAKIDPATGEEQKGEGLGYVSVFGPTGTFIRRFASTGKLNAPWAMAMAPANFGSFAGAILVGNFGDGKVNAFDANSGDFLGQLKKASGTEISVDGLWGLAVGNNQKLYFAAGIQDEEHGLLGTLGPN